MILCRLVLLLIALIARNAILIVEVAGERRLIHREPIVEAAINAARASGRSS